MHQFDTVTSIELEKPAQFGVPEPFEASPSGLQSIPSIS
jgi:hypothetical protein